AQALLVAPRRRDDLLLQHVRALGVGLDRGDDPAAVAAPERPVLDQRDRVARRAAAPDALARLRLDVVAQSRADAAGDAILVLALAVHEAEVLDRVDAEDLDAVVPAAVGEVGEAAAPLDEQVGAQQPPQLRVVAGVPRRLRRTEELLGALRDRVRRE